MVLQTCIDLHRLASLFARALEARRELKLGFGVETALSDRRASDSLYLLCGLFLVALKLEGTEATPINFGINIEVMWNKTCIRYSIMDLYARKYKQTHHICSFGSFCRSPASKTKGEQLNYRRTIPFQK